MLSLADSDGNVKASVIGLAHLSRKTLAETETALQVLSAPDPHSGRKEMEGRRITTVDGGWHLVTHPFYRESGMSEDTKRYWRDRKKVQRERQGQSRTVKDKRTTSRTPASVLVHGNASVSDREEDPKGEGKRKARSEEEVVEFCKSVGLRENDGHYFWNHWEGNGWINGAKPIRSWKATIRSWKDAGHCPSQKGVNNGRNQRNTTESRRNVGTANEGRSSQYAGVGKIQ